MHESKTKAVYLTLIYVCAVASTASTETVSGLTCAIAGATGGLSLDTPVRSSSLKPVDLEIRAMTDHPALVTLRTRPDSGMPENVRIRVYRQEGGSLREVTPKWDVVGSSRTERSVGANVRVGIPVSAAKRKKDVEDYVQWVEQDAAKNPANTARLKRWNDQRPKIIAAFEELYFENEVGIYRIQCEYRDLKTSDWSAVVSSAPIYVNIEHLGNFFDQPNFRKGRQ